MSFEFNFLLLCCAANVAYLGKCLDENVFYLHLETDILSDFLFLSGYFSNGTFNRFFTPVNSVKKILLSKYDVILSSIIYFNIFENRFKNTRF